MVTPAAGPEGPVTVVVTRRFVSDRQADGEAWLRRAIEAASRFPGHLGAFVVRQGPEQVSLVFRFESVPRLLAWEASAERAQLLAEVEPLTRAVQVQRLEGLEPFFALPGPGVPPKWKMAVVTWLVAFPLIQGLQATVGRALEGAPAVLRGAAVGALMVATMTWFAMPAATR
ncbi:MAG: hypothetical protein SFW67_27740, partial [Myxococcaceae bacterium]|nr:hypothetical protein [Myxococcaceae bacterium]